MCNFASTLVKFSKLSHIQTTVWRPPKMAPPRTAGSAGPFVTPLHLITLLYTSVLWNSVKSIFKIDGPATSVFIFKCKLKTYLLNKQLLGDAEKLG